MLQQRFGLALAHVRIVALAVAGVSVALCDRTLGLEVVDHRNEVLVLVVADGVELLGQRLARGLGECGVIKNNGLADRRHLRRLVDESDADDVFVGAEILRGLHKVPLAWFLRIQRIDEVLQGVVTLSDVAGHAVGVLDLRQAEDVGVQLVDGRDDLRLLVIERVLRERAANLATVSGYRVTKPVLVVTAFVLVLTKG